MRIILYCHDHDALVVCPTLSVDRYLRQPLSLNCFTALQEPKQWRKLSISEMIVPPRHRPNGSNTKDTIQAGPLDDILGQVNDLLYQVNDVLGY